MSEYRKFARELMDNWYMWTGNLHPMICELAKRYFIPRAEKPVVRIGRDGEEVRFKIVDSDAGVIPLASLEYASGWEAGARFITQTLGYTVEPFPPEKPVITAEEWGGLDLALGERAESVIVQPDGQVWVYAEIAEFGEHWWIAFGYGLRVKGLDKRFDGIESRESLVVRDAEEHDA